MEMLSGAPDSAAIAQKYVSLRTEGMGVEQAMIYRRASLADVALEVSAREVGVRRARVVRVLQSQ